MTQEVRFIMLPDSVLKSLLIGNIRWNIAGHAFNDHFLFTQTPQIMEGVVPKRKALKITQLELTR